MHPVQVSADLNTLIFDLRISSSSCYAQSTRSHHDVAISPPKDLPDRGIMADRKEGWCNRHQ